MADTPPWRKPRPKSGAARTPLTPESIAWARARATRAGRRYPNLVDNMAALRRQLGPKDDKPGSGGLSHLEP